MLSYNPFSPLAQANLVTDSFEDRMFFAFLALMGDYDRLGVFDYLTLGLTRLIIFADNFLAQYRAQDTPPLTRVLAYLGSVVTYPLDKILLATRIAFSFAGILALSPIITTVYLATLPAKVHRELKLPSNPSFADRMGVAMGFFTGDDGYAGVFDFLTLNIGRLMIVADDFLAQYRAQGNPPFIRALAYLGSVVTFPSAWILMGARMAVGLIGTLAVSPVVAVVHVTTKAFNWVRAKMSGHEENAFDSDSDDEFSSDDIQERRVGVDKPKRPEEHYEHVAGLHQRPNNMPKDSSPAPSKTHGTTHGT